MIIGHLARIVAVQSGGAIKAGFVFVALLAVFNAGGRVAAGVVSDRIGRMITVAFVCILQAFNMAFFASYSTEAGFLIGSALVGFNYGACLSLFPSSAADLWGTRNLGLNYGILFTAWGVGGVFGPMLAGSIADAHGSYGMAYHVASLLLAAATVLALLSYVAVSVNVESRELTIRLSGGRRVDGGPAGPADGTRSVAG
jgi:MFS family permease